MTETSFLFQIKIWLCSKFYFKKIKFKFLFSNQIELWIKPWTFLKLNKVWLYFNPYFKFKSNSRTKFIIWLILYVELIKKNARTLNSNLSFSIFIHPHTCINLSKRGHLLKRKLWGQSQIVTSFTKLMMKTQIIEFRTN